jgi:hypothetical protein
MDRYDINSPKKLKRLAELVELSKSLIMTFISISDTILNFSANTDHQMIIDIHKIYPGLVWNHEHKSRSIFSKQFIVNKEDSGRQGSYIKIEQLNNFSPVAIHLITIIRAVEIPFVGVFPQINRDEKCTVAYYKVPVVPEEQKRPLDDIDLRGVERYLFETYEIPHDLLVAFSNEFFKFIFPRVSIRIGHCIRSGFPEIIYHLPGFQFYICDH